MKNGEENNQESINDYKTLLDAIRTEARKTREEIKEEIKQENTKLLLKIKEQNIKIENLEIKYSNLETRYKKLERQCRKNNVVVFGLSVEANANILQVVTRTLNDLLNINITENDINNIYQITKPTGAYVKIEFASYLKKAIVIENANKLKGTKISIVQDLNPEDLQDQKILRTHLKLAKSKNYFAKIKGHKLIINDNVYTAEQLKQMEAGLNISTDEVEHEDRHHSAPTTQLLPCENFVENSSVHQKEPIHIVGSCELFQDMSSHSTTPKRKKSEKEIQESSSKVPNNDFKSRVTPQNSQK